MYGKSQAKILLRDVELTLRYHGVTQLATANLKNFQDCGFKKNLKPSGLDELSALLGY